MYKKILGFLFFVIIITTLYRMGIIQAIVFGDVELIEDFLESWGIFAPLGALALILLQALVAPLPAVFIYIANGIIFGVVGGFLISWLGSLLSAYVCFSLIRHYNFKIRLNNDFLQKILEFIEVYQEKSVFVVRLMPFIPQDIASYAFGLTVISGKHFLIGTALGQTPAILFYSVWGGMHLPLLWNVAAVLLWAIAVLWIIKLYDSFYRKEEVDENKQRMNG